MHALLVEDDDTIADFVARGLREAGFAVDRASDGAEGLEAALEQPYDVAVVDVMLPKRDGLSVIDELRRKRRDDARADSERAADRWTIASAACRPAATTT